MNKIIPVLFCLVATIAMQGCKMPRKSYVFNEGLVFGTIYHFTYESEEGVDLHDSIKLVMNQIDESLSPFNDKSIISKVNRGDSVVVDSLFVNVFRNSLDVWKASNGAFDPTVAPLVNAWGFGFKNSENITPEVVDSLLVFVGMDKINMADGEIFKKDSRVMLDFGAIAKGYAVDVVCNYLKSKGCSNYMVEIGGEVSVAGVNKNGRLWRIGINQPNENEPLDVTEFQAIIELNNMSVATSGNYRNFYEKGGRKYAHTINPATGYPVEHSLLSVSVLADNCMEADAWATAFMVMGKDEAEVLANNLNGVEAFFVFDNGNGQRQTSMTKGFKSLIVEQLENSESN